MKCRPGSKDAYAALLKIQVGRVDSKLMDRHSQRKKAGTFLSFSFVDSFFFLVFGWLVGCLVAWLVSFVC